MKDRSAAEPEEESHTISGYISDWARDTYKKWNNAFAIEPGDTFWLRAGKVTVRIVILLLSVALSPLILVGLFFALIAAL